MLSNIARKFFGTPNDRFLKKVNLLLEEVNKLEPQIEKLTDDELRNTTLKLKKLYSSHNNLDLLLARSFCYRKRSR